MIILLMSSIGVSTGHAEETTELPKCYMTIKSVIPDSICIGDFLWGYYMPHLNEFALRGQANYNLPANPNGQSFIIGIPKGDVSRAELVVYTIKVEQPKPKPTPPPSNPTSSLKPSDPLEEEPKTNQPKAETPKTSQPQTQTPSENT